MVYLLYDITHVAIETYVLLHYISTLGKWKLKHGFFLHFHLLIISNAARFKTVNSFLHAQNCQELGTTKWWLGRQVDEPKQALVFGPARVILN